MAKELDDLKATQQIQCGSCSKPCDMNMDELERVLSTKLDEFKCSQQPQIEGHVNQYDRTGKPDYALESAGGSIVTSRCSQTYKESFTVTKVFGIPIWWSRVHPREVINPNMTPGHCWAMQGSSGSLVIKLAIPVIAKAFSYEHIPVEISVHGNINSAPQEFAVFALRHEHDYNGVFLGSFTYDHQKGEPLQTFSAQNIPLTPVEFIEFKIMSNWGNPKYTCMYRFRVHGDLAGH
jgi:SUN domain-containing protein 1/2